MSEHNYAGLAFKIEREQHPEWFNLTEESVAEAANRATRAAQALHAKNDKQKKEQTSARVEYNQLRRELFDKQQWAKSAEIYCNEWAGKVKLLEQRINDLLKQKKVATEAGQLGQERFCEHNIQLLETELLEAKIEFNRAKHQSSNAARGLKNFDGYERIKELAKELDTPKAIGKENL